MAKRAILIAYVVFLTLAVSCGKTAPAATLQPTATLAATATAPPTDTRDPTPPPSGTPRPEKETGAAAEGLIAFYSERDGNAEIYTMRPDGSDEHKLVETEFTTHHPDWHPDGTRLSFDSEFNLQGAIYLAPFQIKIRAFPTSS